MWKTVVAEGISGVKEKELFKVSKANQVHPNTKTTLLCMKIVICVANLPPDLARVVEAWEHLPEAVLAGTVVMVNAARQK